MQDKKKGKGKRYPKGEAWLLGGQKGPEDINHAWMLYRQDRQN
jgi:hypothetical protein